MSTLRLRLYRRAMIGIERLVRARRGVTHPYLAELPAKKLGVRRAWFHAASVGELESLRSVVDRWCARGDEAVVTVFSASATQALEKLLRETERGVVYAGPSPFDGQWHAALAAGLPDLFVTAKYEAWPELWASLGELRVPLVIVGARKRRSLAVAHAVCRGLGARAPELSLLPAGEGDLAGLCAAFPNARVRVAGEPRWDRVRARAQAQAQGRAQELVEWARRVGLPRPWGMIGSAWPEDLERWGAGLLEAPGTLWVIPHRVEADAIQRIEKSLEKIGISRRATSRSISSRLEAWPRAIIVDESGFLSELYAFADWACVGGGFGKGVHSTIEPALQGLPIAIGPAGADRFPEIAELAATGQLEIAADPVRFRAWLAQASGPEALAKREGWRRQILGHLGATERVLEFLDRPSG